MNENNAQNKDNNEKKNHKEKKNKQKTNTTTTNKTLITIKTFTVEERKKKILIYYIQTMKRLPCLICSVNITFIKTIRSICL